MHKIRIWDLPVRLFHWVLVILVATSIITQKIGGNAMEWHFRSGYAVLTLIAFRIVWGLAGSRYARFSDFMYGPSAIVAHLRQAKDGLVERYHGHNPLGSLSVFALLGVLLMQAVSGLFANDEVASEGPLAKFISNDLSGKITWFHADISPNLIYALIGLHITAIAYYYFRKKRNLVKPMITGDMEVDADITPANDSWPMRLRAAAILGACGAAVYYVVTFKP
jgi:cytochrome b